MTSLNRTRYGGSRYKKKSRWERFSLKIFKWQKLTKYFSSWHKIRLAHKKLYQTITLFLRTLCRAHNDVVPLAVSIESSSWWASNPHLESQVSEKLLKIHNLCYHYHCLYHRIGIRVEIGMRLLNTTNIITVIVIAIIANVFVIFEVNDGLR